MSRTIFALGFALAASLAAQEPAQTPAQTPAQGPLQQPEDEQRSSSVSLVDDAATAGAEPVALEVAPPELSAAEAPEVFVEANRAYEDGEYQRAVELYRSLGESGTASGHLYYNLGNAFLRNGELGRAIASYRRSQVLLPRDEDVAANLSFARQTTQDALAPPVPSPVVSKLLFWHHGLSLPELRVAALVLNVAFWLLLGVRLLRPRAESLRWLAWLFLVPLLAVVISLGVRTARPSEVAVVVPQEIQAQSGPGRDAVVRFKLHAGTEVRLKERRDDWLRVVLPDGQQGWIEARYAEVVAY